MLPRNHRLHPRSRVRATIRHGRRARSGAIMVHYLPDSPAPRAAVVAGRTIGGSVQRHRRQRQVRHALAAMWPELAGGSYVVRALPAIDDYPGIAGDLRRAIGRL